MFKTLKKRLKNERGLTLIELLAVVVILGIIAAIAVPSIGGLIDNSKKDAHIANAQQMISSTKIAVTGNNSLIPSTGSIFVSLKYLEDEGYIETVNDPDKQGYKKGVNTSGSGVTTTAPSEGSFVEIKAETGNKLSYHVKLVTNGTSPRGVRTASNGVVSEGDLNRGNVR